MMLKAHRGLPVTSTVNVRSPKSHTEQANGIEEVVDAGGVALNGGLKGGLLGHVRIVAILGEAQPPLCAPLAPRHTAARAARSLVCTHAAPCSNFSL